MYACLFVCVKASQSNTGTKKAEIWHVLYKNPGECYETYVGMVMGVVFT